MYDGSTTTIRTPHGHTGAIDVTDGVHQGSALSPFLFLLTMSVITQLVDGPLMTILYADDIALIAESNEELQDRIGRGYWRRMASAEREEDQVPQFRGGHRVNRRLSREVIEEVQDFRYLGSDLAADEACTRRKGPNERGMDEWR
nr:endonuclease-reverse transcriptase HmRTE-e01 [Haemonchus contortus]